MEYVLVALMATILGPMAGHAQQRPVKVLSSTNGQQLLVEVEEPWSRGSFGLSSGASFSSGTLGSVCSIGFGEATLIVAIRPCLSFDQGW